MTGTEITENPIYFMVVTEEQVENNCCNGDPSPGDNCIKAEFIYLPFGSKIKKKIRFGI